MRSTIPLNQNAQNFSSSMGNSIDNIQKSIELQAPIAHSQTQSTSITDSSLITLLQNARQQRPNNKINLEYRTKSISQQNQLDISQISPSNVSVSKHQQQQNNILSNDLSIYLPTNIVKHFLKTTI